jgi:hypothetical protein
MEATRSSETLADFQKTAWHYIPEDRTLHVNLSLATDFEISLVITSTFISGH